MTPQLAIRLFNIKLSSIKHRFRRHFLVKPKMTEFTELYGNLCIFSCLVLRSHEYSVAYENLQPSTDAYKRVAYKKMSVITLICINNFQILYLCF